MADTIERKFEVTNGGDPDHANMPGRSFAARAERLSIEMGISLRPFGASAHVESVHGKRSCIIYVPAASAAIDIQNINSLVARALESLELGAKKPA